MPQPPSLQLKVETKTARLRGSTSLPSWPELRGVSVSDLHWRGFLDVPVITSVQGGETGADGLLARVAVGRGTVLFCQAHPDMFPVDAERAELQRPDFSTPPSGQSASKTYFRLSRWRTRRLLGQLANNLGAGPCPQDEAFLHALSVPFQSAGRLRPGRPDWLCIADGSRQGEAKKFFAPSADLTAWTPASVPHDLKPAAGQTAQPWKSAGPAWFRKSFTLPAAQSGKEMTLALWVDAEESAFVWINGHELVRYCRAATRFQPAAGIRRPGGRAAGEERAGDRGHQRIRLGRAPARPLATRCPRRQPLLPPGLRRR